jgi:hypothetical protein
MRKSPREVLHVFDYDNIISHVVLDAREDSRLIQQRRDNDIVIYR